ncbi:hypothetical protein BH09PSE2_BH09PSE2_12370 [soil metagenome]
MSVFDELDREPGAPRLSDLWEWARDDYKAGETADVVCQRHGLSRSQFYERARREGWLRRDQPTRSDQPVHDQAEEYAAIEALLNEPAPSAFEMQRLAWARMQRAILMNRRTEAQGWARLAATLRKLAVGETQGAATWAGVARRSEPDSPDSPSPLPQSGGGGAAKGRDGGGEIHATETAGEARSSPPPESGPPPPPRRSVVPLPRCAGEEKIDPASPDSRISAELFARLNLPGGALNPQVQAAWLEVAGLFDPGSGHGLTDPPPETSRALSTACTLGAGEVSMVRA